MQEFETGLTEKESKLAASKLPTGFGAITPKPRPEDFHSIREEVEKGIAEEVVSEA